MVGVAGPTRGPSGMVGVAGPTRGPSGMVGVAGPYPVGLSLTDVCWLPPPVGPFGAQQQGPQ